MHIKHYLARMLDKIGLHSNRHVEVDPVLLYGNGKGIYDITSMCRFCGNIERDHLAFRTEPPVVDLNLQREYYDRRNGSC